MSARWYAVTTPKRVEHVYGRLVQTGPALVFRGPNVGDQVVVAYGPGSWDKVVPEPVPPECSAWYSDIGGPAEVRCERRPNHPGEHAHNLYPSPMTGRTTTWSTADTEPE